MIDKTGLSSEIKDQSVSNLNPETLKLQASLIRLDASLLKPKGIPMLTEPEKKQRVGNDVPQNTHRGYWHAVKAQNFHVALLNAIISTNLTTVEETSKQLTNLSTWVTIEPVELLNLSYGLRSEIMDIETLESAPQPEKASASALKEAHLLIKAQRFALQLDLIKTERSITNQQRIEIIEHVIGPVQPINAIRIINNAEILEKFLLIHKNVKMLCKKAQKLLVKRWS